MIETTFRYTRGALTHDVAVRFSDVRKARGEETSAPWEISVRIMWGAEVAFDRALAGADPLHAVELAARFAAQYIQGRAEDDGGTLNPPVGALSS